VLGPNPVQTILQARKAPGTYFVFVFGFGFVLGSVVESCAGKGLCLCLGFGLASNISKLFYYFHALLSLTAFQKVANTSNIQSHAYM